MASKREDQMAAKYAEVVERNKQLERQNTELLLELEVLRANAISTINGGGGITKAELKQMISEILLSERESIKTTFAMAKCTDNNIRNTYNYFMELATGEQFQNIIKEINVFRQQAIETTNAISIGCKALSQASRPKVTNDYKKSMNEIADRTAKRINEKLIEATDSALERVRKGSPCMMLSATAAFLLFIVLFIAIAYFGISLAYNHYILHSSDLFKIQYWCLGMAGVPLLISWISLIWSEIHKRK